MIVVCDIRMTMNSSSGSKPPSSCHNYTSVMSFARLSSAQQKFRLTQPGGRSGGVRRPSARRALTELGTRTPLDRKSDLKYINDQLRKSREDFTKRWNFDPILGKPVVTDNPRFSWSAMKSQSSADIKTAEEKEEDKVLKEKKEEQRAIFSLPDCNRSSLRLSQLPQAGLAEFEEEVDSGTSSTDEDDNEEEVTEREIEQKKTDDANVELLANQSKKEAVEERLQEGNKCDVPSIPTVTASIIARTNNNNNLNNNNEKQLRITEFIQHHKRARSEVTSEDSSKAHLPSAKRIRLQ